MGFCVMLRYKIMGNCGDNTRSGLFFFTIAGHMFFNVVNVLVGNITLQYRKHQHQDISHARQIKFYNICRLYNICAKGCKITHRLKADRPSKALLDIYVV